MSKRLTIFLLMLLGVVLLLAQTTRSEMKLTVTKVELSGEVKLSWTKPLLSNNTTLYEVYRAKLPGDTAGVVVATVPDTSFVDHVPQVVSSVPQYYGYYILAKTGVVTIKSNVVVIPVPGVPLIGAFKLEGKVDSGKVTLSWPGIRTPIEYYLVFRSMMMNGMPPAVIQQIDSTTNLYSITDVPPVTPGTKQVFSYFVRAKLLLSGEFLQSTLLQLTIENRIPKDEVKFVSVPNLNGQKDSAYRYTAKAISSDAAEIRYSGWASPGMLTMILPDFKIDSVTGIVDWTPKERGYYNVVIVAKSNKGGTAKQYFTVAVSGGNGIITGKVTDTLDAPIPNVVIEVFKTENNNSLSFAYTARTDNNGRYQIGRVDLGVYKIKANAPSGKFQSQWYLGKREASQANPVQVDDSAKVGPTVVSFKLRGGISILPKLTIQGSVMDTTGLAINNAETRVVFVRAEFALNLSGGPSINVENFRKYFDFNGRGDVRLEGNSEFVFKAKVDSLGRYSVSLPPGGYIAFARAKGYAVEFYADKSNIMEATVIFLSPDITQFVSYDFTLSPLPPVVLGGIKGSVIDSVKNIPIPARVVAFRDGWRKNDPHTISRTYVTDTDSLGLYEFTELLPGTYIVMALPLGSYAPSFYTAYDTVSNRWKRASKIEINGNSVDNINIYVKPLGASANGYAGITGNVTFSGGNGNGQVNSSKSGAFVFALRDGEIAGYAITNASGEYMINGLAPGSYSVSVDKAGYNESSVQTVTVGYDIQGSPMNGSASFVINSVLSVTVNAAVQPVNYSLEQNYPNPFNPSTSIRYSLPNNSTVSLKVYNMVGQEVATLINSYQTSGEYTVTFNAANLASGVYFYRLDAGSFNVAKKMLLLK